MTTVSGILHVHSRFSYDGKHSLDEIADFGRRRGYGFICMSEHSNTLDASSMAAHVAECERVSTDACIVIPGVEFSIGNLHLLGFGVRRLAPAGEARDVARFIRDEGGAAVVAHPVRYHYQVAEELAESLTGIEVWNGGYDGRFVPDHRVLRLWQRLKASHSALLAFGGPDLHRFNEHNQVKTSITCETVTPEAIMQALREGRFAIVNGCVTLDARTLPGPTTMTAITAARTLYETLRRARSRVAEAA
jgi:hypothetical protein